MILFIFEGERREVMLFESLEHLFFSHPNEIIVCSFGNNIYELYRQMQALGEGADIIGLMKENGKTEVSGDSADYSDVFLFFDLDIHNANQSIATSRQQLHDMLEFFNNETENGRLYINYPMIESIYHTEALPDPNFINYTVKVNDCHDYKKIARDFGPYNSLDHLCVNRRNMMRPEIVSRIRRNWLHLIDMNVAKSAALCNVSPEAQSLKSSIDQNHIFKNQEEKYIEASGEIAVLNSFPLFLFDYFKPEVFV